MSAPRILCPLCGQALLRLAALALGLSLVANVSALTLTWNGGYTGANGPIWNNASNWNGTAYAENSDLVFTAANKSLLDPIYLGTSHSVRSITFSNKTDQFVISLSTTPNPPGAAAGLTFNSTSAPVARANTTNLFRVRGADNGTPDLSATQQFDVFVNPLVGPGVTSITRSNNQTQLQIAGDLGPDFTVQATTNLSNWTTLMNTNSPTLPLNWTDTNAGSFLKRFHRVLLGP